MSSALRRSRAPNRSVFTDVVIPTIQNATDAGVAAGVGAYVGAKVGKGRGDPPKS
jgi:hypothetical protein